MDSTLVYLEKISCDPAECSRLQKLPRPPLEGEDRGEGGSGISPSPSPSPARVGAGNHFGSRQLFLFSLRRQRTNKITIGKVSDSFAGLREGSCHVAACVDPHDREV
jgi:hypothetical protein